jgi:ureidoacrylate peracid hydrolase
METADQSQWMMDPSHTALLVIDMQNDFCHPKGAFASAGLDVSACAAVATVIARLLDRAREAGLTVVFTRTVHSPGSTEPDRHRIVPGRDHGVNRRALCLAGTWGAQLIDGLQPRPGDLIVDKRRYSAFYDTALEAQLRERGVGALLVTGVTTNACVDSTVRDAFFRGLDVIVVADAVAAFEPHLHASTLENLALLFGAVVPACDVLAGLHPSPLAPT